MGDMAANRVFPLSSTRGVPQGVPRTYFFLFLIQTTCKANVVSILLCFQYFCFRIAGRTSNCLACVARRAAGLGDQRSAPLVHMAGDVGCTFRVRALVFFGFV